MLPTESICRFALKVRERELRRADHVQKSDRPAAMLHVGPARFAHRREIKAVPRGDEIDLVVGQRIGRRRGADRTRLPIIVRLRATHGIGEGKLLEFSGHAFP